MGQSVFDVNLNEQFNITLHNLSAPEVDTLVLSDFAQ